MVNYKIEEIHSGEELKGLKRKSAEEILKTINEQKNRQGRKKRTKEEFITRYLRERGYLLTKEELIIYDQYPLRKRPVKPKRVDIIYIYRRQNTWSLGIVEAKIERGDNLKNTIEQLLCYKELFLKKLNERIKSFQTIIIDRHNLDVTLPSNCQITQLDILAPSKWWVEQFKQDVNAVEDMKKHNIRSLCIPNDYIPTQGLLKDIKVEKQAI